MFVFCYPNPFNPATTIRFSLPESSPVKVEVFNVAGQRVATLVDGMLESGPHEVSFDAGHLPSGVYLYRLASEHGVLMKRMVLMK